MFELSSKITRFELRPLGECVEVLDYMRKPLNSEERRSRKGVIPYYGANGQVDTIDDWIFDEDLVLVAEDGGFFFDPSRAISYRITGKAWVNNHAHVLRPLDHMDVDWLNFSLCQQNITAFVKGATLKKLNQKDMRRIPIPCPPISEQRRIAARIKECMERVEEIEALRHEAEKEAQALLSAARYEAFQLDLNIVPLGTIIAHGPTNGLYKPSKYYGSGVPILRIDNFRSGDILSLPRDLRRLSIDPGELSRYSLEPGHIVLNRVNGSLDVVGKACLIESIGEPTVFESNMMAFKIDVAKADPGYVLHFLSSPACRDQIKRKAKVIQQGSINQKDVASFLLPLSDLEEQRAITDRLDRVREYATQLVANSAEASDPAAKLRDAILRKAFAGEL